MKIQKHQIGKNSKVFVIAEIGMNHNGIYKNAIKLIDKAVEIKADCVKFQIRNLNDLYSKDALKISKSDLATQYTINLLKKFQLTKEEYRSLAKYSKSKNIVFLCTPWDKSSVDFLEDINVPAYKVASADLTNFDLLKYLVKKKKPLIISTGMSTEKEIKSSVNFLKKLKSEFALLHCNSTYPAPFKDVNLMYIKKLEKHNVPIGYSGHERGISISLGAVSLGAKIIERHITLSRDMEGPDHAASLEPKDFNQLIVGIRELELALGSSKERKISQGEFINRENLSKSIFAKKNIKKNVRFNKNMFEIKSPGHGLSPNNLEKLVGTKSNRIIKKGTVLFESDLQNQIKTKKKYKFKRPWAIPVRFHDINKLLEMVTPDLVEFHLSFNDLDENISKYFVKKYDCDFLVHAPELFANDHLLDLCTNNKKYRSISMKNMEKVIKMTLKIKKYFPKNKIPKIVVNCGGFSRDNFIKNREKNLLYRNLENSLRQFSKSSIEILPQTMAPYPWHFGGQRFQNLFLDPKEIVNFCKKNLLHICHDLSHSYLACNKFGWDHSEYTKTIAPYVSHYHVSDASGVDGEGLTLGKGEIDFINIFKIMNKYSAKASFIPEVWQGHKNNGEGFWKTLKKIERKI